MDLHRIEWNIFFAYSTPFTRFARSACCANFGRRERRRCTGVYHNFCVLPRFVLRLPPLASGWCINISGTSPLAHLQLGLRHWCLPMSGAHCDAALHTRASRARACMRCHATASHKGQLSRQVCSIDSSILHTGYQIVANSYTRSDGLHTPHSTPSVMAIVLRT